MKTKATYLDPKRVLVETPLDTMPLDCPHFSIDKELVRIAQLNYRNVQVIEKLCDR